MEQFGFYAPLSCVAIVSLESTTRKRTKNLGIMLETAGLGEKNTIESEKLVGDLGKEDV